MACPHYPLAADGSVANDPFHHHYHFTDIQSLPTLSLRLEFTSESLRQARVDAYLALNTVHDIHRHVNRHLVRHDIEAAYNRVEHLADVWDRNREDYYALQQEIDDYLRFGSLLDFLLQNLKRFGAPKRLRFAPSDDSSRLSDLQHSAFYRHVMDQ